MGEGAGKVLRVQRVLVQISASLSEKESKENDLHKKRLHLTGRIVFKSRQFRHNFCPNFSKTSL